MSLTSSKRVDLFVLGLSILEDDGAVTWTNAAWQNIAASGATLSPHDGNQLALARTAASGGHAPERV